MDVIQENVQIRNGIQYHRKGIVGDYDDFTDVEELISFIKTGKQ